VSQRGEETRFNDVWSVDWNYAHLRAESKLAGGVGLMRKERAMTWRWSSVVTGLFAATLWSGPVFAQSPLGLDTRGMPGGPVLPVFIEGVGLSDAQRAQVRRIVVNHQPQVQSLVAQLRTASEALAARLYGPDPVSAVVLTPLVQQVNQLRSQLTQERLQVTLEIRDLLTPDQLARAAQIRQRLNEWRADMQTLAGVP
jgi:Spy/CpxP family protein refolding chaperone